MRECVWVLVLTAAVLAVHGYHYGVEDAAIYLPAIKKHLDPSLYPHDAAFFLLQAGPTLFDELIAVSVRWSHAPIEWVVLAWHLVSLFLFLLACRQLSRRLFDDAVAQWAGVALVAAVITLPVAGTLVTITSEYLHPRNLATASLLFAWVATLDRKLSAYVWLAVAAVLHPQMAVFGAFHLLFQAWRAPGPQLPAAMALPFAALTDDTWRDLMLTRRHHFPLQWRWYEQLGAVAPLVLLAVFARIGRAAGLERLMHVSKRLALSGTLAVAGAVVISVTPGLERLIRTQGMRSLHLVYIFMFLIGGGLLGRFLLRRRLRWILLFAPLAAVMCWYQLQLYPASRHIEWPGLSPRNGWLETFEWIRDNTPRDAFFALDPRYMERPGEDHHGFRALAERSMLADYTKDRGVAALFPDLAEPWRVQFRARERWHDFSAADFSRLSQGFKADWVVIEQPAGTGLDCPYANENLRVCRLKPGKAAPFVAH